MAELIPFDPKRRRRKRGKRSAWTRPEGYGFTPARPKRGWSASFLAALVVLPALAFTAVLLWEVPVALQPAGADREAARFGLCGAMGSAGGNCVIDGDTFRYAGEKIRIADINTPETSEPECAEEAELGAAATGRLRALLNEGPFTLEPIDRDRDRYGRLLRTVTRDGESLGAVLVDEGLAEEWQGYRGSWC